MAIEIKAPTFPESIADGTVATWHKQPGDVVKRDELLVDIETDKVVLEVVAPADGVLVKVLKNEGDTVLSEELIALVEAGAVGSTPVAAPLVAAQAAAPSTSAELLAAPAARKLAEENGIDMSLIATTGKDGRVTKEDVVAAIAAKKAAPVAVAKPAAAPVAAVQTAAGDRVEKRVPMTRVRATVAKRLVEAQSNMAMLTTFNEVDMTEVMALRSKYKDLFEKSHNGVRLGFMSFFVKAATEALKRFPAVNASIDGTDIVYHGYADVGVAVSSDRGLVVPVLRNAEIMSLAEIEGGIATFGKKARDGKLSMDDMTGGTFTITNGGTF
ncbi:MAG: dihydrolipoyllysine-residue succinyltransferase, partial [Pseudomonadaceae bacterium]|nr:dihydrolipoyllysine-residue succinyltransferase [Pseudomonadaceae bacterium]